MAIRNKHWPRLELAEWQDTYETVHLWSQIVGKVRLFHMPWINHSWHIPLYVTARGLGTSVIPYGDSAFSIDFDFVDHRLLVDTAEGTTRSFRLESMSVASFYKQLMRERSINPIY